MSRLSKRQQGGIAAGVLLIALGVAVLVFGGGDDEPAEESTIADSTPPTTTAPAETDAPDDRPKKPKDQGNDKPGGDGGTPGLPEDQEPPGETIYGPPGAPAGTVPPGGGPTEDEEAVVRTLRAYLGAIKRGDGPQACAQLSKAGRKRVERELREAAPETAGTPCEGSIVLYQGGYQGELDNPRFKDLQVSGGSATAIGPPNEDAALSKYGRTWLIDNYGWD